MQPLGVAATTSAIDAAILKKTFGLGTTLIISNEEKCDVMKMVKSFKESSLLTNSVCQIIWNKAKKQKGGFLPGY